MATSITYKGAQIASLTTGTKTLKTSGKYMEGDVIVSATGGGEAIAIVDELDSHGGTIRHISGVSLESDTVSAAVLLSGYTAHDSEGNVVNGQYVAPTPAVLGSKTITANGIYAATTDSLDGYSEVTVSVPITINWQSKSATPTESQQTITPDSGYALSQVTVGAIDSSYVGTAVTRRSSSDLTATGSSVSVPSGYYSAAATKAISAGSAITPDSTVTANPTITVNSSGLITATVNASKSVTPNVNAGYISVGTAGTITASGSATSQLTTQAAATITPTKATQTAVAAGRYTTGAVTVAAIPSQYIEPTGNKSITENGSDIDVASYATVTVSVSGGGGGGMATVASLASSYIANSAYTATNIKITIPQTGTYTLAWDAARTTTSGTTGTRLYRTRSGTTSSIGTAVTTFNMGSYGQHNTLTNQSFQTGDVITIYARSRNTSYSVFVCNLIAEQTA